MTRIKCIISAVVGAVLIGAGLAVQKLPFLLAMIFISMGAAWFLMCLYFVPDQTAVQVHNWIKGTTVRVAGPGLHFACFPIEKPARAVSTRRTIIRGTTPGGRSTDGIPCDVRWSVYYQLAPQNLPPQSVPANADLLFRSPNTVLFPQIGSVLLGLVSQKTAVGLATAGGWTALNGSFERALRIQLQDEGFTIQKALVEGIEFPTFLQMAFDQAAIPVTGAHSGLPPAARRYHRLTHLRTAAERNLVQGMSEPRTIKKTLAAHAATFDALKYLP